MKKVIKNLLAKAGLNASEQKFVVKTAIISTAICAVIVAAFWAFHTFSFNPQDLLDGHLFGRDAGVSVSGLGDFDVEAHEFAGQRLMQTGRPDAALPHFQRVAAVRRGEPAGLNALDKMISAFLEIGEFEKALETIEKSAYFADGELSTSLQVRRGIALYNLKEFDESSKILQRVLERDPRNIEALCFMAQMEAAAQTPSPTAERFFKRAFEADSSHIETRYQYAKYHEVNGDYAAARTHLEQVLEKDPLHVRAYARLGMIHYYEINAEQALKSYQTALALNPFDYNTRYNLGELYRTLFADNKKALQEFMAALELNPNHAEANYRAGLICAANDMLKEAIRYYEASLQNDRQNIRKLLQLAVAYERLGDKPKALSVYQEITNIDPLHSISINKIKLLNMQ